MFLMVSYGKISTSAIPDTRHCGRSRARPTIFFLPGSARRLQVRLGTTSWCTSSRLPPRPPCIRRDHDAALADHLRRSKAQGGDG